MRVRLYLAVLVVILFGACSSAFGQDNKKSSEAEYRWTMINVNSAHQQGDAHLITGNGKTILLDAGHQSVAQSVLLPFLARNNISKIDAVFISHPHSDHYGGLKSLLNSGIDIKRIYMGHVSDALCEREYWGCSTHELSEIRKIADDKGVPICDYDGWSEYVFSDDFKLVKVVQFNEATLESLKIGYDLNELSLIAILKYRNIRVLFAGDLNKSLSNYLVDNYPGLIKCEILKVPHHGTEGTASDRFFKTASPRISLVPGPAELWLSDRSKRVRNVLEEIHSKVYVNGLHGDVTVVFSKGKYRVEAERE